MSLLAVELNDAGLLLARTGGDGAPVLAGEESPGLAVLHEGRVHVGGDAVRRYRIAPLHGVARLGRPPRAVGYRLLAESRVCQGRFGGRAFSAMRRSSSTSCGSSCRVNWRTCHCGSTSPAIFRPHTAGPAAGQNFLFDSAKNRVQPLTAHEFYRRLPISHRLCRVYAHTAEHAPQIAAALDMMLGGAVDDVTNM